MELMTKVFFCGLICVLALVVGRGIAHALVSKGASAYEYDISLPLTDEATDTILTSPQDELLTTATPILLAPRPTLELLSPTVISFVVSITPTTVASVVSSLTRTISPVSTLKPTYIPKSPTLTVAASATAIPSPTTVIATSYVEYTVRKGDTLLGIAKSFGTTAKAIINLNQDLPNPEQLQIGQVLRIPSEKTK